MAGAGRVSLSFWTHLRAALWQELMISMINGSLNESLAHEAESVRLALRGREGGEISTIVRMSAEERGGSRSQEQVKEQTCLISNSSKTSVFQY